MHFTEFYILFVFVFLPGQSQCLYYNSNFGTFRLSRLRYTEVFFVEMECIIFAIIYFSVKCVSVESVIQKYDCIF